MIPCYCICVDGTRLLQVLTKSQKKRMKKKASAAKAAAEQDDSGEENEVANGANKPAASNGVQEVGEDGEDVQGEGGDEGADVKKRKKKKKKGLKQTEPPSVPIAKFFPDGRYPEGEWQSYNNRHAFFTPQICSTSSQSPLHCIPVGKHRACCNNSLN